MSLDVNWNVAARKVNIAALHAPIAIVSLTDEHQAKSHVYNDVDELTGDYDESTEINKIAQAVSDTDGYNAPIQVIEYPKDDGNHVSGVTSKTGVYTESGSPIVTAVEDNVDAQNAFIIPTSNVPESDVEAIADALYNIRGGSVAYQVSDFDTMHKFATHIQNTQQAGDGNVLGMFENRELYPAAQAAAYMAANAPVDLMKIGQLSQFEPTNLTPDQVRDVLDSGFNVIENKADMFMVSTGKAVGGSYLDHFVNTKMIRDRFTFTTQVFMNTHEMPYTQATIDALKLAIQSEANNLYKENFFINEAPVVSATSREDTSNSDVGARIYRGINVKGDLFNSIEKFNGNLTLDE